MPLKLSPTQIAFNAREDGKFNRPFQAQVDFFRGKLNLPTERWDDIVKSAHDRAFIVAGAAKADLLNDLRGAVDNAIVNGESIQAFRKRFNDIVRKHGWEGWTGSGSKAGRDWRTRVIYQTNLSTSYAAGRFKQLNDPDLVAVRPYWKYIHNDTVQHPRPLHVSWSGMVLHKDDPWWQTHMPPNGWGCRCRVKAVRESEFKNEKAPDDGSFTHIDSQGKRHSVPNGIDFGFDYQPGANAHKELKDLIGRKLPKFPDTVADKIKRDLSAVGVLPDTFVPAKTITEATERIKNLGVDDVSLKGLKKSEANAVLEAVENESRHAPIKLNKLSTYRSSRSRAAASYTPMLNWVKINLSYASKVNFSEAVSYETQLKKLDDIKKQLTGYLGDNRYAQSTVRARLRNVNSRIIDIEERMKRGEKARPWTISSTMKTAEDSLKTTITHELGHYRHYRHIGITTRFDFDPKNSISEYGRTNSKEYLAEWFVQYRLNGEQDVPGDMLKLFKEIE
ncbi:MAG: hypothetical protein MRK00_16400 [Nitrosomonas sp.]|nr:hypothetical protein [Nitrosomonas sp.]